MPPTIAIVDDDEAVRDSLRLLLESYGYDVRDHDSAASFLAAPPNPVHCLLLDQHMPGMTGTELLDLLHSTGRHMPVVMVTGRSDAALEQRIARFGAKLLQKPVMDGVLMELLQQLCPPAASQE